MGFQRYPNTMVISWQSGTDHINQTTGAYTAATLATIGTVCNAQPQSERYAVDADGNRKVVRYVISFPLQSVTIDKKTAKIDIFDETFVLINLFNYQLHSEIVC
jgi:hypothetical protein